MHRTSYCKARIAPHFGSGTKQVGHSFFDATAREMAVRSDLFTSVFGSAANIATTTQANIALQYLVRYCARRIDDNHCENNTCVIWEGKYFHSFDLLRMDAVVAC